MSLEEAAEKSVKYSFRIRKGEKCLIVTDMEKMEVADAYANQMKKAGAEVTVYMLSESLRPYSEMPKTLEKLFKESNFTTYMIDGRAEEKPLRGKMVFLGRKHGRICMMPGLSKDMVERAVSIDYKNLSKFTEKIHKYLKKADNVIVKNTKGTYLNFSVKGRKFELDVGDISKKGMYGNLPAGEIFTAPVEKTFWGIAVFDLIDDYEGMSAVEFKSGKIIKYHGNSISKIIKTIGKDKKGIVIGEFGIGTNPKATVCPQMLEAEKTLGTVHFAIGDSYGLGKNKSKFHFDFLITEPDVIVDGKHLMKKGKFIFE